MLLPNTNKQKHTSLFIEVPMVIDNLVSFSGEGVITTVQDQSSSGL
jgi:hypothetical protein